MDGIGALAMLYERPGHAPWFHTYNRFQKEAEIYFVAEKWNSIKETLGVRMGLSVGNYGF